VAAATFITATLRRYLRDRARTGALAQIDPILLALTAVWSCSFAAAGILRAVTSGATFVSDGRAPADQLQYLAWIRDAGTHGLISDRFTIPPGAHTFLHPMFLASGVLWRLGVSLPLSYIPWKFVGLVAIVWAVTAYMHRLLPGSTTAQRVAMAVALFAFTPGHDLLHLLPAGAAAKRDVGLLDGELSLGQPHAGDYPILLAVALMVPYLLGVGRIADHQERPCLRRLGWIAAAGLGASWLHPWQGITLLGMSAGLVVWRRFDRELMRRMAIPVAGVCVPLAYYLLLTRIDPDWRLIATTARVHYRALALAAGLLPFLIPAAFGFLNRARSADTQLLFLWVPVALLLYAVFPSGLPPHFLDGLTMPLAVLLVFAWRWTGWRSKRLAAALLVLLVYHAGLFYANTISGIWHDKWGNLLTSYQARALAYLEHQPHSEGVLAVPTQRAEPNLAAATPAFTGHPVWAGHYAWSRDFPYRQRVAEVLLYDRIPGADAAQTIRETGTRWILLDCGDDLPLATEVRPIVRTTASFGCVRVIGVR
jgi:hypothetical protein